MAPFTVKMEPLARRDSCSEMGNVLRCLTGGLVLGVALWQLTATGWGMQVGSPVDRAPRSMVATVHPLATAAGLEALQRGGNAVDAAIAAALTLGVVDGGNSGIGGGCFVLIRTPAGEVFCLDARETAPAQAHRDMFMRDGKPDTRMSQVGALAIGVPGALAGYAELAERFGNCTLSELLLPAADLAETGFVIGEAYAQDLAMEAQEFRAFPGAASVFLDAQHQPWPAGSTLIQKDLANTYRKIAQHGVEWFYRGDFAIETAKWMEHNGGILSTQDFADYRCLWRSPLKSDYRGFTIWGFPPPSSGGVHVAQVLNILEAFDLKTTFQEDPGQFHHLVSEAMKLAFADRAYWLGDPDFAKVPQGLLDDSYSQTLSARIDPKHAIRVDSHGMPPAANENVFPKHTTHLTAVDREGYWVAITTTVNTTFGSKVVVPGFGVILNNQMDDFSIAPGVANAFGLIGAEANAIAPGKRPLSSMSPTLVEKNGRPILTTGAAGGPRIITSTLWTLIRVLDLNWSLERAIGEPRLHHQWSPDRITVEADFPEPWLSQLKSLGHEVQTSSMQAVCQAILLDPQTGELLGVTDPRVNGSAAGR